MFELTHASCRVSTSICCLWNLPRGIIRRDQPDMEGRKNCWLLEILWYTFRSDDKVQPNPLQIWRWFHNDTCYKAEPICRRQYQVSCEDKKRRAFSRWVSIVQLFKQKTSIAEVPIHVCVGILHSYTCISSHQKQ